MYVDQRANPAQQLALVAMANELSKGLVGTIVQVSPAPIQSPITAARFRCRPARRRSA